MARQPTYLLAPNFHFKPGTGPIVLGNIIADPLRPHRALTTVDAAIVKATYPRIETITDYVFWTKPEERDPQKLADGRKAVTEEFAQMSRYIQGEFLVGPLSAADFWLYPPIAFMYRARVKLPDFDADGLLTPELKAWKARIEALPYFEKTVPPHWKQS